MNRIPCEWNRCFLATTRPPLSGHTEAGQRHEESEFGPLLTVRFSTGEPPALSPYTRYP